MPQFPTILGYTHTSTLMVGLLCCLELYVCYLLEMKVMMAVGLQTSLGFSKSPFSACRLAGSYCLVNRDWWLWSTVLLRFTKDFKTKVEDL